MFVGSVFNDVKLGIELELEPEPEPEFEVKLVKQIQNKQKKSKIFKKQSNENTNTTHRNFAKLCKNKQTENILYILAATKTNTANTTWLLSNTKGCVIIQINDFYCSFII